MSRVRPILKRLTRAGLALGLAAALAGGQPASAQILGGGLPSLPSPGLPGIETPRTEFPRLPRDDRRPAPPTVPRAGPLLPDPAQAVGAVQGTAATATGRLADPLGVVADLANAPITEVRRLQAERLLREHPDLVEADDHGAPVVRGEILAIAPAAAALARIRQAGFGVRTQETLASLGLKTMVLTAPRGVPAAEAVRLLRALDPGGQYDFNHLYQESGTVGGTAGGGAAIPAASGRDLRIGLVDGSVAANQPSLRGARLVQRAFAPGGARATPHATAVASLIAGAKGAFRGAAPGATLMVADVYGPTPTGGSAEALARALAWMAESRAPVINVSLVGPPNLLLAAAVGALVERGHLVVAAVGNDGPAAPPLYPAAYPGVVAVTGVDAAKRVLPEAGRGTHVDFAAPGAEMAAAGLGGGFVSVRGTSFAAPIAAGRLARFLPAPDRGGAARAMAALAAEATDLGARGPDPIYGRGLVGFDLRTDPATVGARFALHGP